MNETSGETGRTEEHERMVTLGYYAGLVARQWNRHPSAKVLAESGYDVAGVMAEMSKWAYEQAGTHHAEWLARVTDSGGSGSC